ncbi:MAG: hypothetical protein Alpg2KO_21570 [Alphaproteobacteria bacterium]
MKKLFAILILLVLIGAAGGVAYLGTWNVPLEQDVVHKPLPASNFGDQAR